MHLSVNICVYIYLAVVRAGVIAGSNVSYKASEHPPDIQGDK